jgi:anti-anti-sigma regulatory factor
MSLTDLGSEVVISVRGDFDVPAASRLHALVLEYVVNGGAVADIVLDLQATTRCRSPALERLTGLIGAGLRLRAGDDRRARGIRERSRASCDA